MCQAYEGERQFVVNSELREIQEAREAHKSGGKPLTDEEINDLAVRKLMLMGG